MVIHWQKAASSILYTLFITSTLAVLSIPEKVLFVTSRCQQLEWFDAQSQASAHPINVPLPFANLPSRERSHVPMAAHAFYRFSPGRTRKMYISWQSQLPDFQSERHVTLFSLYIEPSSYRIEIYVGFTICYSLPRYILYTIYTYIHTYI